MTCRTYTLVRRYHGPDGTIMVQRVRYDSLARATSDGLRLGAMQHTIRVNLEVMA